MVHGKSIRKALTLILAAAVLSACRQAPGDAGRTPTAATQVVDSATEVVITATPAPIEATRAPARTLVICLGQEPDTLYPYGSTALAQDQVLAAVYDGPIDNRSFDYQAIILEKLPSLADGDAGTVGSDVDVEVLGRAGHQEERADVAVGGAVGRVAARRHHRAGAGTAADHQRAGGGAAAEGRDRGVGCGRAGIGDAAGARRGEAPHLRCRRRRVDPGHRIADRVLIDAQRITKE